MAVHPRPGDPVGAGTSPREHPADVWEGCSAAELRSAWGLPAVHLYARVGSTNDIVRGLAADGAPSGSMVIAEEQKAGRGRVARTWLSPPGVGLWCSFLLRDLTPEAGGTLPLRVALAAAGALDDWVDRPFEIKWPNDLVFAGRKIGGILCEGSWDRDSLEHVAVGIGINLLQGPMDFPEEFRSTAGSLRMVATEPVSRFAVATAVVEGLRPILFDRGPDLPSLLEELAVRDAIRGRRIDVFEPESGRLIRTGVADGIASDGSLRLMTGDGIVHVRTGTVRFNGG